MRIPKLELNEWLDVLEPSQKQIMSALLEEHTKEDAMRLWLTAEIPQKAMRLSGDKSVKEYFEHFKEEVKKFICEHPDYAQQNAELKELGKVGIPVLVTTISAFLAVQLGVLATVISPVLVIMLFTVGKIGKKAYCSTQITEKA